MRNNKGEAMLKASTAELVGPLLKRLSLAKAKFSEKEQPNIIDKIITEVQRRIYDLHSVQKRDRELTGHFGKIERQIDSWIDDDYKITGMNEETVCIELEGILGDLSKIPYEIGYNLSQTEKKVEVGESSRSVQENKLSMKLGDLDELNVHASLCLYSLGIFPENIKLKKRFVIYWWTGLGLLPWHSWKEAQQHGDKIFSDLVEMRFLEPVHIREHNKVINLCSINSTIYTSLFSADKREDFISPFFGDWFKTKIHVNLDQRYLNSQDISNNLQVVQLGNWHYTDSEFPNRAEETGSKLTMSNDHIEVDKTDFLKNLGEKVTYLSLRGISGIEGIPESIGELENLMILDLRACHNLSKLPQKPRSMLKQKLITWKIPQQSWFKKLTVLDISECYLLDYMPKWVCELSNLEVFKGFVVGGMGNKNQLCQLGDISKLNKLRKLTIRIAREHSVNEDFNGLKSLQTLLVLTIIWGHKTSNFTVPGDSFPEYLEKLDIRCYPKNVALELQNPAKLKNLRRLYIRGGKLTTIPCNGEWNVEILRLRFLKELKTDWGVLMSSFKNLSYVEFVKCPKLMNFPTTGTSWSKKKGEPIQNANASDTINLS